jgi:hypothetical protein
MHSATTNVIILLVLAFSLKCTHLSAQGDYIVRDTVMTFGIKLHPAGPVKNAMFITAGKQDYFRRYTPYQIDRYGLSNGKTYHSREIVVDGEPMRVFLERLENGTTTLFRYKTRFNSSFFFETGDGTLHPLERNGDYGFREVLATQFSDCKKSQKMLKRSRYSRNSLKRLFYVHNHSDEQFFTFRRLVFNLGYGYSGFLVSQKNEKLLDFNPTLTTSRPLTFGISLELPARQKNITTVFGVHFSQSKLQYNSFDPWKNIESDHFLDLRSISTPVIARYYLGNNALRYFVNLGAMYTYNASVKAITYETEITSDARFINQVEGINPLERSMVGFVTGAGVLYHLDFIRTITFEFRYSYSLIGLKSHRLEQLFLLTGINF